ncbi:MAG: trigger factor [Treponemataceae bacterium]
MNLKKEFSPQENSSVKLSITIAKADVAENYTKIVAEHAKKIQIPGFRRGKVPVSILEKKYGEELRGEAAAHLMDEAIREIFEDPKIEYKPLPYSQPELVENPQLDLEKDLVFSVTYDVAPTVTVKNIEKVSIEVPSVSVSEDDLQEELKAVQERNAMVIDKKDNDKAGQGDIVTINYCELDEKDSVIAGSERQDYVFTIGTKQNIYEIDDEVIGMKKAESKDIAKTFPKNFENKDLAGKAKKIRVLLTALKMRDLPALDDELAQDVNEKYKTLADLKADIQKNLEASVEHKIEELKANAMLEKLIELNDFTVPQSMIQAQLESRWIMMARQFQTNADQLEKLFRSSGKSKAEILKEWEEESIKMLKSRIIVDNLVKEHNITVSDEDVEAEIVKIAEKASVSVDEVKKHYSNEQELSYLKDDMQEKLLYKILFKKITIGKGAKKSVKEIFSPTQN